MSKWKTIGVVGVGPRGTSYFHSKLVSVLSVMEGVMRTRILIDADPTIPDRTKHLLGDGPSPLPALVASAKRLIVAGAEIIAVPSNTASVYRHELEEAIGVPVPDSVVPTIRQMMIDHRSARNVGLLLTEGVYRAGLFERSIRAMSRTPVHLTSELRTRLTSAIYGASGIFAGNYAPLEMAIRDAFSFFDDKADLVILGCAEALISSRRSAMSILNPLDFLAFETAKLAMSEPAETRPDETAAQGTA